MLTDWMQTLSNELQLNPPLKEESQGHYLLPIGEEHTIHVWEKEEGYSLMCDIAPLPQGGQEELLTHLMHGNLLGQGTYGNTLAFRTEEKMVCVECRDLYSTEYEEFKNRVEDFINCIDYWHAEIQNHQK